MTEYIKGSVKEFDYANNIVFIDKIVWGDKSYQQLKVPRFKKGKKDKALRYGFDYYINLNSFFNVDTSFLKGKMRNRFGYFIDSDSIDYLLNDIEIYKGFSYFIPFDLFKKIYEYVSSYVVGDEKEQLLSFNNLFVFSSKITAEDIKWLRSLGLEDFDYLKESTIHKNQAMNLRLVYNNEKEKYDDNRLIEWMSEFFKVQRPTIKKIINNEIFNEQENKGLSVYLQNDFLPTMLKDINFTIQNFINNVEECYNNLNQSLSEIILYEMDKDELLKEIAIYLERKEQI